MGEAEGYGEINLNVGCPSDRVQSGTFGAVLMKEPALVADCVTAMQAQVRVPVTVKCRIGVDDQDPQEVLPIFLNHMVDAGIKHVAIHARKAWLNGLSPKENRDVPPLDYPLVHQMKATFPDLQIAINGGIASLDQAQEHLAIGLDGAMIGRAAYQTPWDVLSQADSRIFEAHDPLNHPAQAVEAMLPYIETQIAQGHRLNAITRHMLGLFTGRPGARIWRRVLSEGAHRPGADSALVKEALKQMQSIPVAQPD